MLSPSSTQNIQPTWLFSSYRAGEVSFLVSEINLILLLVLKYLHSSIVFIPLSDFLTRFERIGNERNTREGQYRVTQKPYVDLLWCFFRFLSFQIQAFWKRFLHPWLPRVPLPPSPPLPVISPSFSAQCSLSQRRLTK